MLFINFEKKEEKILHKCWWKNELLKFNRKASHVSTDISKLGNNKNECLCLKVVVLHNNLQNHECRRKVNMEKALKRPELHIHIGCSQFCSSPSPLRLRQKVQPWGISLSHRAKAIALCGKAIMLTVLRSTKMPFVSIRGHFHCSRSVRCSELNAWTV